MIELLLQADRLLTVDLVDAADAIYRKVAEADPRNAIAVVGMARCALARGDDHEAYRLAARALAIDPQNDMARRMEARLDEVLRTRGEVPGQGVVAATAAASATEDVPGAAVPGVVAPPVKHRWPATPTTVRPVGVAPSVEMGAAAMSSASAAAGDGAMLGAARDVATAAAQPVDATTVTAQPGGAPTRETPTIAARPEETVAEPATASGPGDASAPGSAAPAGSSWASRIHHDDPPAPAPATPPAPSSVPSGPSAQAVAPDHASGTPGQSGTQAPSVAASSPSKRSLLDRLRGR